MKELSVRQAIHIFKKDVRFLWPDICFFAALTALWAWKEYAWTEALLPIAAAFLIARLIHAEAIPGHTQFWITRPYKWSSLLAAKILFMAAFITVPVLAGRVCVLNRSGFQIPQEIFPLLWSQFLMFVGFALPIAALAAITADMVTFIFSSLVLFIIGGVIASGVIPSIGTYRATGTAEWPEGVEWMRLAFVLMMIIGTSFALLAIQYKTRNTRFSRSFASVLLIVALLGYLTISPALATDLHARFSTAPDFGTNVRVQVGSAPRKFGASRRDRVQISLPLDVSGIPAGVEVHVDASTIAFETGGTRSEVFAIPIRNKNESGFALDDIFFVKSLAEDVEQPIKLSGVLYLTAFSSPIETDVDFSHGPVDIGNGVRCYVDGMTGQLHCASAFRWPSLLLTARIRNENEPFWSLISYSPFPAGMELSYIEDHRVSGPPPHDPRATIQEMKPLSHFRTEFSMDNFNLNPFVPK